MILLKTEDMRLIPMGKNTQYVFEEDLLQMRENYIEGCGEYISIGEWMNCFEEVDDWNELNDIQEWQVNGEGLTKFMKGLI
jgi:hypothetical protein